MHKSNPHLHRLDESPIGLKSPGLISSISRSQRDLTQQEDRVREEHYTSRFARNGHSDINEVNDVRSSNKKVFLKGLKETAPELYKTLEENEEKTWISPTFSTPIKSNER